MDGFGQNELMDEPLFLKVRPGDAVLYEKDQIGKVLTFVGGSRDPDAPSLFQIADVDSGEIRWIHGEEVTEIVAEYRTTIKSLLLSTSKFSSNNKKERLFAPLLIIPFNPAKIAVIFFGDGKGSKEFHKASFLSPLV